MRTSSTIGIHSSSRVVGRASTTAGPPAVPGEAPGSPPGAAPSCTSPRPSPGVIVDSWTSNNPTTNELVVELSSPAAAGAPDADGEVPGRTVGRGVLPDGAGDAAGSRIGVTVYTPGRAVPLYVTDELSSVPGTSSWTAPSGAV